MIFALASQYHVYLLWVTAHVAKCFNSVINVKALLGAFNHEKALVGTFSVFVKLQASFPGLHGVRVTMRGDMNGDSVCISGSGSGLHPRPCPGVWWPAQPGTTGQWAAAAPGPGHRTTNRHLPNSRTRAAQ